VGDTIINALADGTPLNGILHVFVAFDWGEEVDLEQARKRVPAEFQALARRPRTPSSIAYRPAPLRFVLGHLPVQLPEIGQFLVEVDATLFDFAAVSASLRVPFQLTPAQLTHLAGWLADPTSLILLTRSALTPLHQQLKPAISKPEWRDDLSEEYLVFEFPPSPALEPQTLVERHTPWLASLLALETTPLSAEELADAVRLRVSYSPSDLFLVDWAAAVLIDEKCGETLQVIELSNLQLLEYRYIDNRLDDILAVAYRQIQPSRWRWRLPQMFHGPLRQLGELKVEANEVFERTGNVLKLVGDQYLSRAYRQLAERFHLRQWEESIQRKLEVIESVYKTLSDQSATARGELLEIAVVVLIVLELVTALVGRH
jgi:hypothetical protein